MAPLSMTFSDVWYGFQGHNIYEIEYLKKGASYGQSYYCTLIGNCDGSSQGLLIN